MIEQNFTYRRKIMEVSPNRLYPGLDSATKQSILSTFGAENGSYIITATVLFIENLTTFEERSIYTALVNEDPLFVCSLPLQSYLPQEYTMPIRWLMGDGTGYINTGVLWNVTGDVYKLNIANMMGRFLHPQTGIQGADSQYYRGHYFNTKSPENITGKSGYLEAYNNNLLLNGVSIKTSGDSGNSYGGNVLIFNQSSSKIASFELVSNTEASKRYMVPFKRTVNNVLKLGMIDILNYVFYVPSTNNFTEVFGNIVNGEFVEFIPH